MGNARGNFGRRRTWRNWFRWGRRFVVFVGVVGAYSGALYTAWLYLLHVDVEVFPPTAFAVFRGFHPFPSDHLALPLDIVNGGGRSVVVRHLALELEEVGTGSRLELTMAGEIDSLTSVGSDRPASYRLARSLVLPGFSASQHTVLFHVSDWFDPDSPNYEFRFTPGSCFRATLRFAVNRDAEPDVQVGFDLSVFGDVAALEPSGGRQWEFYSLKNVVCASPGGNSLTR